MSEILDPLHIEVAAALRNNDGQLGKVFALLEEGLKKRYPDIKFVSFKEFGNTHGSDEREVLNALSRKFKELKVDAVVSGMGC